MKTKTFWYLIIFLITIIALPYCPAFNTSFTINREVKLANGQIVALKQYVTYPSYFGHPHVIDFTLGYDLKDKYSWEDSNKKHIFKSNFKVFIIEKWNKIFYIVALDTTSYRYSEFRFFKELDKNWEEINYKDFPKEIAFQNLSNSSKKPLESWEEDYKNENFSISFTGYLWVLLEKGHQYHEKKEFNQDFYVHFYEMYIKRNQERNQ